MTTSNTKKMNTYQVNNTGGKEFGLPYQDVFFTAGYMLTFSGVKEDDYQLDFSIQFDPEKLQAHTEALEQEIEQKWDKLFAQSQDLLMEWANEALEDYEAGRTIPLYRDDE